MNSTYKDIESVLVISTKRKFIRKILASVWTFLCRSNGHFYPPLLRSQFYQSCLRGGSFAQTLSSISSIGTEIKIFIGIVHKCGIR